MVKDDIMKVFKDFFETRKFVRSLTINFLVVELKNYRPISLVGSLYKPIAKVLANILKKVVCKLVNKLSQMNLWTLC